MCRKKYENTMQRCQSWCAGRSESTPGDCLFKTQLPANSQEDV